jgi:hypothetical protein
MVISTALEVHPAQDVLNVAPKVKNDLCRPYKPTLRRTIEQAGHGAIAAGGIFRLLS